MSAFSDIATYRLTHTIYAEASVDALDATNKTAISFSDTVTGNFTVYRAANTTNVPLATISSATTTTATNTPAGATPVATTFYKMALGAQLDNIDNAWSGLAGVHDSSGALPVNPVRCFFGVAFAASNPLNGRIKRGMILPRKMTLAELQTKTT